ncbi:hypothetical protein [Aquamicrobium ahrensii]|uniref:Uncharacterized protein n=1 Tax=Aquamicrobium ahrensii TaxID=469551 RepID=A0ABV2KN47_9HYPH
MNRFLAETLSLLNAIIAVLIVVAGVGVGYQATGGAISGMFAGAVAGALVAELACGTIAYLVLIERHLSKIASDDVSQRAAGPSRLTRQEPVM